MRAFEWRPFLAEHRVPYVERGPNVKRGEINIRCPFCGSADPSHHMGLELETGWWSCWRNRANHSGKSPVRLIAQLLNVPYWRARKLAGLSDAQELDPDGFDAVAARIMGREGVVKPEQVRREFLAFPPEFKDLHDAPPRFYDYLRHTRGFGTVGTRDVIDLYGLTYAARGTYRDRIILPYYVDGELVAWTARAIAKAEIRYRDLDSDDCLVPIKETLFNLDCRMDGGRVLVVVEGPIDALKIDLFGRGAGVRAVALSTNSVTDAQTYLLEDAAREFDRVLVMMDMAGELGVVDSMRMKATLSAIPNVGIIPVPYGLKDAAEMSPRQATAWAAGLFQPRRRT